MHFIENIKYKISVLLEIMYIYFLLRGKLKYKVIFFSHDPIDEMWIRDIMDVLKKTNVDFINIAMGKSQEYFIDHYRKKGMLYIRNKRVLAFIKADVMVTSTSSIDVKWFNKSIKNYIYVPHSLASLHMVYPENFCSSFDSIFSAGPHHSLEFSAIKSKKNEKYNIYDVGYCKSNFNNTYKTIEIEPCPPVKNRPQVLLAPSWGKYDLEKYLGIDFFEGLLSPNYDLIYRPHPLVIMNYPDYLEKLQSIIDLTLDMNSDNIMTLLNSQLLITDFSGISMEFMALTKRPVVFLNLPKKVVNNSYQTYGIEPMESLVRKIEPNTVVDFRLPSRIKETIGNLLEKDMKHSRDTIKKFLYNAPEPAFIASKILEDI